MTAAGRETFTRANVHERMHRLALADVKGYATPAEAAELRRSENLLTWLRVLRQIRRETETHTAKNRAAIEHLKPIPGTAASKEYVQARREQRAREAGRLHFQQLLAARSEEAQTLIGAHGLTKETLGTIIEALLNVEVLLDEREYDGAHDLVSALIDRYEAQATGRTAAKGA